MLIRLFALEPLGMSQWIHQGARGSFLAKVKQMTIGTRTVGAPEVRSTEAPVFITPARHFFFDGTRFKSNTGKGNFAARKGSGALHGTVKILPLKSKPGRFSLRTTDEGTIHVTGNTQVTIDGDTYTLSNLYAGSLILGALGL